MNAKTNQRVVVMDLKKILRTPLDCVWEKENNDGFSRTKDDGGKGGLCILRFGLCVV